MKKKPKTSFTTNRGYSLIEILIVVTLTVMIITAATSVLLTALLSNGRVNTVSVVKQNGDFAMAQMTTLIRNASKFVPNDSNQTCEAGMTQLKVQGFDGGVSTFERHVFNSSDARIASSSGLYLTSDAVYLTNSLRFDCVRSADGLITTVNISFVLTKGNASSDRPTEYGQTRFAGSATVRSF